MKFSLNQFLQDSQSAKISSKKLPFQTLFEDWLDCDFDQKNLKTHDKHIEEYEETPEENLLPSDYRIEIERRFHKSLVNKIYIFPRKENEISSISSDNSSIESIKPVTIYELSSQNYSKYYQSDEKMQEKNEVKIEKQTKELPLGVNYKRFLSLLEKTIKNVNISDLKNIKMNNFFKKDAGNMMTPTTTHKETALKTETKFKFLNRHDNSLEKRNKTVENSKNLISKKIENSSFTKKFSENSTKKIVEINGLSNFLQGKKIIRPQVTSFNRNNNSQMNSPVFSMQKM